jgi:hypothetical protein
MHLRLKNNMFTKICYLFILTLLFQTKIFAQNLHTISGIVKNEKGEGLPYVSVLMAGSTRGTQTNESGKFTINNVVAGNYQLIISYIGYDRLTRSITLKDRDIYQEYELKQSPVNLNEVVVSFDPDRDKHLALFKKFFIGETVNARQCLLLNPDVIHTYFDKNTQLLSVSADSVLIIDNQALGYRVKYLLTEFELDLKNATFRFSGIPVFEELKAGKKQKDEWDRKRQKAYNGSIMHFFRSAYNNSLSNNGFIIYSAAESVSHKKAPLNELDPTCIFFAADSQFVSARIDTPLYVIYNGENTPWDFTLTGGRIRIPLGAIHKNAEVSKITLLADSLIIDKNGNYVSDKNHSLLRSIEFQGYWTWKKVADLLPFDYEDKYALINASAFAQSTSDPVMEKVVGRVDGWLSGNQPEKVYLQTDKPYYAAGDNIWFKAYITAGSRHQLSVLSASVNVELLDERDSVKQWIRLPVTSGMARGDIALPDTLRQGKYRIRAYTNWMRNAGPDYYFDKQLTIGNENAPVAETKKAIEHKAVISFFPEGGNLVTGLKSVVAFKAVGGDGLGIDAQGSLTDAQGHTVCTFSTAHLGIGRFSFTPEKGKSYTARVTYRDGSQSSVPLPAALNDGYVLQVNNADSAAIYVQVRASAGLLAEPVYLYAQAGGETRYTARNKPGVMPFNAVIPKSLLPSGIAQFTLFSSAGEPLNERIVFIDHPEELLKLDVHPDKLTITSTTQAKVKIGLEAHDAAGQPVTGSFLVAVIDESKVSTNEDNETTILSQLLLTADLKGYIEQPAYYFNKDNDTTRSNLDILMMTQGYRRFAWKPLLAGTIPPALYPADRQASISGTIKTMGGKPVPGAKVTLFSTDGSFLLPDNTTDGHGHFSFPNLVYKDSVKFELQASSEKNGKNVDVVVEDTYERDARVTTMYPGMMAAEEKGDLSKYLAANEELYSEERKFGLNNHAKMLKDVNIRAASPPKITRSSNLNGPGNANVVISAEDIDKRGTIDLMHTIEKFVVSPISTKKHPVAGLPSIEFILDGRMVPEDEIDNLSMSVVSSIEYLKKNSSYTTIYGADGQNGVIIVTTKGVGDTKPDLAKVAAPGILAFTPKGYYLAREFYSPQYDDKNTNKTLANLRNTIYWQPDLVTNKEGHTSFEYYNAGSPGTYRVTIEGIGTDGNLGRLVYRYKVE